VGQSTPIGRNTVLIVEPEALVRFDMIAFFEERGLRVYEAEDADQAMDILDERNEIRVVLIDATASGRMDGLKLAHYVRERFPPTLLFVLLGNAPGPQDALPQRATFLPKPFDLYRVMRQIEQSPVTP
jgi:DNA-binding NtrC family response regulator